MRRPRIFSALLAVVAICAAAAPSAGAQAAPPAVREKAGPRPVVHPAAAQRTADRRDTAQASKSVSQRLFEARWVIFPARLALVIVFVTVALLLLLCGAWSAVRVAHSLRHTKWSEPPRRLKRGEVGAAGTTVAVEWEERLSSNTENDEEQDRQIALLDKAFDGLTKNLNAFDARLTTLETLAGVHTHEQADGCD
jgi:hypothetical protein